MDRKGFQFYRSYWDVVCDMDAPQFKEFVSALCLYYFDGEDPAFDDVMLGKLFLLVKPNIDSNIKNQESGSKGGRPSKGKKTDGLTTEKTSGFDDTKPLGESNIDIDRDIDTDKDLLKDVPVEIKNAFAEYQAWRRSIGKGYGSKNAVTRAVNRLQECAPGDYETQTAIIYQALDGKYTQFVPLVDKGRGNNPKPGSRLDAVKAFAEGGC